MTDAQDSNEWLPCPFCAGGSAYVSKITGRVFCEECGTDGPWSPHFDGDWNTRVSDPATAAVIRAARKMAAHYTEVFASFLPHALEYHGAGHKLTLALTNALKQMDETQGETK